MRSKEMTMAEAVGIARRTLAEHYDLYLIDSKMNGRNLEGHKAADAYNKLAEKHYEG